MNWEEFRMYEWRCVAGDGHIVGRVNYSRGEYEALVMEKGSIGWFTTLEYAQKAVERTAIARIDALTGTGKKEQP